MSLLSTLRNSLAEPNEEAKRKQKEQLDFLLAMAKAKLDGYQARLDNMYKNPDESDKWQVVAQRQVKFYRQYRVNVSEGADKALGEIVNTFFDIGGPEDDDKNKKLKAGFQKIITTALEDILGNAAMGEQETTTWAVGVEHNAIIRTDVSIWKYNFSSKGVISEAENAMAYVFCKGVVDHTKLTADEFTYLISQHAGDGAAEVVEYIGELQKIWAALGKKPVNEVVRNHLNLESDRRVPLITGA